jgi:hypothetical protein
MAFDENIPVSKNVGNATPEFSVSIKTLVEMQIAPPRPSVGTLVARQWKTQPLDSALDGILSALKASLSDNAEIQKLVAFLKNANGKLPTLDLSDLTFTDDELASILNSLSDNQNLSISKLDLSSVELCGGTAVKTAKAFINYFRSEHCQLEFLNITNFGFKHWRDDVIVPSSESLCLRDDCTMSATKGGFVGFEVTTKDKQSTRTLEIQCRTLDCLLPRRVPLKIFADVLEATANKIEQAPVAAKMP